MWRPSRRLLAAATPSALGLPDPISTLPGALDSLTLEDVNGAIQRHVRPADLRIVVVTEDADGFIAAVRGEAATPIVYEGEAPDAGSTQGSQDAAWSKVDLRIERARKVGTDGLLR